MAHFSLSLLGPFIATLDQQPVYKFRTNKAQALLIYLATESEQIHRREFLMSLLWPDMPLESAQVNLRQTVYRLRQLIPEVSSKSGENNVPLVLTDRLNIYINPEAQYNLDINEFKTLIETKPEEAVPLYRGDFLTDFFLPDSADFENWAEATREGLRRNILGVLDRLAARSLKSRDYTAAQKFTWRHLEIDHLSESAYRNLMTALVGLGQRTAALAQFQRCQERLKNELGVDPSPETIALYNQIQENTLMDLESKPGEIEFAKTGPGFPIFMLTDIEESTRLWDHYHELMLQALFQHNTILETQINKHGGRILELRGDGVKAVFENTNPLACAIAIQKDFQDTDWGEIGALKIRIGLHGTPAVRQGHDYFIKNQQYYGPALNHTARIMDTGRGGQILVSEQVYQSCTLPPEASWFSHGPHHLKSLDVPINIFQLMHPDIKKYAPATPLRTAEPQLPDQETNHRIKNNLPADTTPFVGRETELQTLDQLLQNTGRRLVTIVGPGGMGKTRLALAFAKKQVESQNGVMFTDGVFFISLAPLDSVDQIAFSTAKTLGVPLEAQQSENALERTTANQDVSTALFNYLHNKKLLLVFDNFEHLLDGASILGEILNKSPNVKFLVTSRARLNMQEEQVFPIQGLEFPDWETPEEAAQYTAAQLFIQSALRVQPNFSIKPDDLVYLTRICRLIGGMPLGIELAASWADLLSLKDISIEIQKSLDFLETDIRNIPDRHRSIRAVFDYSWHQLNDIEKDAFVQLSIFRGGFSRDAAQTIINIPLRVISTLINKTLIQYNQSSDRYQVHELLKQYGKERLANKPDLLSQAKARHSAYYCQLYEKHFEVFKSGQIDIALTAMEMDLANMLTAWDYAITTLTASSINQAIDGLCMFYDWNGHINEGYELSRQVSEKLSQSDMPDHAGSTTQSDTITLEAWFKAVIWEINFIIRFGKGLQAKPLFEKCRDLLERITSSGKSADYNLAILLLYEGYHAYITGDIQVSQTKLLESHALGMASGDFWIASDAISILGFISQETGNLLESKKYFEEMLTLAQEKNNKWWEIYALNRLGWVARRLTAYDQARHWFKMALSLSAASNTLRGQSLALTSIGYLALFLGDLNDAFEYLDKSNKIFVELGDNTNSATLLSNMGFTRCLDGDFAGGQDLIQQAVNQAGTFSDVIVTYWTLTVYAEYLAVTGQYEKAFEQAHLANIKIQGRYASPFETGRLERDLGWASLGQKKYAQANEYFAKSIDHFRQITDDEQTSWAQMGQACALIGLGKLKEARDCLIDALWTTIETQAFIPLIFSFPAIIRLLSAENKQEKAVEIYRLAMASPYLAKGKLFEDIIGKDLTTHLEKENLIKGRDPHSLWSTAETFLQERQALWVLVSELLTDWMQPWRLDPEWVKQPSEPE